MLITETEKSAASDLQSRYESHLTPSDALVDDIATLSGDIILLGAGGKMGPALATLAKRAVDKAGVNKKIIAIQKETFLLNTNSRLKRQQAEMERLEKLVQSDKEIIILRKSVTDAAVLRIRSFCCMIG